MLSLGPLMSRFIGLFVASEFFQHAKNYVMEEAGGGREGDPILYSYIISGALELGLFIEF